MIVEGGARLLEESINETPNRYVESASEGDLSAAAVPRKGIFSFPAETLLDIGGASSLLRYAAGLLWKYVAEQHSTLTGAAAEPAIGVDSYRTIIEHMTTAAENFTITAVRNARGSLPWYGSFDQFSYYDAAATELSSHETTWRISCSPTIFTGNGHRAPPISTPGSTTGKTTTRRRGHRAAEYFLAGDLRRQHHHARMGVAVTRNVVAHKPYATVYYDITPTPHLFRGCCASISPRPAA